MSTFVYNENTLNILCIIILYLFTWYWCCVADALYYALICWRCIYCILMFMYVHVISFAGCYSGFVIWSASNNQCVFFNLWCLLGSLQLQYVSLFVLFWPLLVVLTVRKRVSCLYFYMFTFFCFKLICC